MNVWLLGLLHAVCSLFNPQHTSSSPQKSDHIVPEIMISPILENIVKSHVLNLAMAAGKYEQAVSETSITRFHKRLHEKELKQLLFDNQLELQEVFAREPVQCAFSEVCKNIMQQAHLEDRILSWNKFICSVYAVQEERRKSKLPLFWFPEQKTENAEFEFMQQNHATALTQEQETDLETDRLLPFLPFAMIQHYDKEAFHAFLQVRHEH